MNFISKNKKNIIIGLITVTICLIFFGIYYNMNNKESMEDSTEDSNLEKCSENNKIINALTSFKNIVNYYEKLKDDEKELNRILVSSFENVIKEPIYPGQKVIDLLKIDMKNKFESLPNVKEKYIEFYQVLNEENSEDFKQFINWYIINKTLGNNCTGYCYTSSCMKN